MYKKVMLWCQAGRQGRGSDDNISNFSSNNQRKSRMLRTANTSDHKRQGSIARCDEYCTVH